MYDSSVFLKKEDIKISSECEALLDSATQVYNENFDGKVWYGRCIFISWYCSLNCTFCYRSVPGHKNRHPKESRRSMGSILIEALFCRKYNWRIEFLTGGYGIMNFDEMIEIMDNVSKVYGKKIWLNLGVFTKERLEKFKPYVSGICSSMETLHPEIHKQVCPEKPIAPYDKMISEMDGFKKSIAVIVGLGDSYDDMKYLFDFVEKHKLDRVTIYALKPVKGTVFTEGPSIETYVTWIAKLRIRFPRLEIIAGTNLRRCEEVGHLIRAGSNAFTKFPVTKQFGTKKAHLVKDLIEEQGRVMDSNFTEFLDIDWMAEIDALDIKEEFKEQMREKIGSYLKKFQNPKDMDPSLKQ
jgi:biotin synthase-like enzyme